MRILYFWICLSIAHSSLWNKHYITYSIENDFDRSKTVHEAIQDWNLTTLEVSHVDRGQGDLKFYFKSLPEGLLGQALPPEGGIITINREDTTFNISKVIQHEFAHALGLKHSENENSIMFPLHYGHQEILKSDQDKLNQLYECRYDSVTLLNAYTYIKFKGRHYERIDFNNQHVMKDTLWDRSLSKVTTMYRNNTYFILSHAQYFEYNHAMYLIKQGNIQDLFPGVFHNITAVLTLRNGNRITFLENGYIWYKGVESYQHLFKVFPTDRIQGAYSDFYNIYLIAKDYMYTYDLDFNFLNKRRMCEDAILKNVHCCNDYSNL